VKSTPANNRCLYHNAGLKKKKAKAKGKVKKETKLLVSTFSFSYLTFSFRDGQTPLEKALFSANSGKGVKQTISC
jgi:hypothetical protein